MPLTITSISSPLGETLDTRMLPHPPEVDQRTLGSYKELGNRKEGRGQGEGGQNRPHTWGSWA